MNQNEGMSLSSFFLSYVIPKNKLAQAVDKEVSPELIHATLKSILDEYLLHKSVSVGDVAFISFNRFFDARMAFHLNLEEDLRGMLIDGIESDYKFSNSLFQNKINIIRNESFFDLLDYVDLPKNQETKMDQLAHFFIIPIFMLSSKPDVNPTRDFFSIFKTEELYEKVITSIQTSQLVKDISDRLPNQKFYCGLFENESFVSKYILDLRPKITNISP